MSSLNLNESIEWLKTISDSEILELLDKTMNMSVLDSHIYKESDKIHNQSVQLMESTPFLGFNERKLVATAAIQQEIVERFKNFVSNK